MKKQRISEDKQVAIAQVELVLAHIQQVYTKEKLLRMTEEQINHVYFLLRPAFEETFKTI